MQNNLKSFSSLSKQCFNVNYNFIIVLTRQAKKKNLPLPLFFQVIVLNIFLKKSSTTSTTAVKRVLGLLYNCSNIRYIFCNIPLKSFPTGQMSKANVY